jgi:hypothetical protein
VSRFSEARVAPELHGQEASNAVTGNIVGAQVRLFSLRGRIRQVATG